MGMAIVCRYAFSTNVSYPLALETMWPEAYTRPKPPTCQLLTRAQTRSTKPRDSRAQTPHRRSSNCCEKYIGIMEKKMETSPCIGFRVYGHYRKNEESTGKEHEALYESWHYRVVYMGHMSCITSGPWVSFGKLSIAADIFPIRTHVQQFSGNMWTTTPMLLLALTSQDASHYNL